MAWRRVRNSEAVSTADVERARRDSRRVRIWEAAAEGREWRRRRGEERGVRHWERRTLGFWIAGDISPPALLCRLHCCFPTFSL